MTIDVVLPDLLVPHRWTTPRSVAPGTTADVWFRGPAGVDVPIDIYRIHIPDSQRVGSLVAAGLTRLRTDATGFGRVLISVPVAVPEGTYCVIARGGWEVAKPMCEFDVTG